MSIVEFLKARLDEDESRLNWTTDRGQWVAAERIRGRRGLAVQHQPTGDKLAEFVYPADAEHAAHWQPSRVAEEIAAKRAIVASEMNRVGTPKEFINDEVAAQIRGRADSPVLRAMASVYSSHEDYDEAWMP